MNIVIIGKSGVGKSNLSDLVRNTIFKMDNNAKIESDDPDRAVKTFGSGSNVYNVSVVKIKDDEAILDFLGLPITEQDVIIIVNNKKFMEWFRTVYNTAGVG